MVVVLVLDRDKTRSLLWNDQRDGSLSYAVLLFEAVAGW